MSLTDVEKAFVAILAKLEVPAEEIALLITMLDSVERMNKLVDFIEECLDKNETPKFSQLLAKAAEIISC